MKLSVSNIVWGNQNLSEFLKLLKQECCDGIELAPSLIWKEPILSSSEERSSLKKISPLKSYQGKGLSPSHSEFG